MPEKINPAPCAQKTVIHILDYSEDTFREFDACSIEEALEFRDTATVTWINIDCIHDAQLVEKIGLHYKLHPLTIEDITHLNQRTKIEEFEDYTYIILNMLTYNKENDTIRSEQVSVIVGSNFIMSFLEDKGDVFESVRDRLRTGKNKSRKLGADFLAYMLIDAIVDNYFIAMEQLGENIEMMEEELLMEAGPTTLQKIHHFKREMILLRRSVWPLREVIAALERGDSTFFQESTQVYLRDVYDHTIQTIETIETYRDIFASMLDIYLSSVNNKLNIIMKVLTVIATIFIPLTFIASIYGMNFKYMPELDSKFGYPVVLGIMFVLAVFMLIFFKRKKWL